MEQYGLTLTEVKEQPYFQLLEVLQDEGNKEEEKSEAEQKVYTGTDLKYLFGG